MVGFLDLPTTAVVGRIILYGVLSCNWGCYLVHCRGPSCHCRVLSCVTAQCCPVGYCPVLCGVLSCALKSLRRSLFLRFQFFCSIFQLLWLKIPPDNAEHPMWNKIIPNLLTLKQKMVRWENRGDVSCRSYQSGHFERWNTEKGKGQTNKEWGL